MRVSLSVRFGPGNNVWMNTIRCYTLGNREKVEVGDFLYRDSDSLLVVGTAEFTQMQKLDAMTGQKFLFYPNVTYRAIQAFPRVRIETPHGLIVRLEEFNQTLLQAYPCMPAFLSEIGEPEVELAERRKNDFWTYMELLECT